MSGGGGFDLEQLENKQGDKLGTFYKKNNIDSIKFRIQLKYRKVGSNKDWKKTSPQQYHYNFKTREFWWDI